MNKLREQNSKKIRRMLAAALFAALAYASVAFVRIPNIGGFLTLDFKDVFITVAAMYFDPLMAIELSLIVPLLEFVTVSGTGVYGLIMNVTASLAFSLTASIIYRYKRSFFGAVIGLCGGALMMTAVMLGANLVITPLFMGISSGDVIRLIPKLLLPFNLVKAVMNGALVLMLYKPLTSMLKASGGFGKSVVENEGQSNNKKLTLAVFAVSLLIIVAALCVIMFVWNVRISFFDIFKAKK